MEEQSSFAQIEAIRKQQDAVDKVKAKYDDEQKRLKAQRKKERKKALKAISTAMKKITKTYEEERSLRSSRVEAPKMKKYGPEAKRWNCLWAAFL